MSRPARTVASNIPPDTSNPHSSSPSYTSTVDGARKSLKRRRDDGPEECLVPFEVGDRVQDVSYRADAPS